MILATPHNMAKYGGHGVIAYDRYAHTEWSATAGDYFWQPDDQPLIGMFGKPLILARKVVAIVPVKDNG